MPKKGTSRSPGVGELRARLDYGDLTLQRSKFFYEDCRYFIRHYVDTEGNAGSMFYDRSSRDHLKGIEIMTEAFLESKRYGSHWWPDDPDHRNANRLQYSTSKIHIRDTMRLLFFRINVQYQSNVRCKKKKDVNSTQKPTARNGQDPNRDQSSRGSSVNDPIDIEHAAPMSDQPGGQHAPNIPMQEPPEIDPYDVPTTPDLPDLQNAAQGSVCRETRAALSKSIEMGGATTEGLCAASSGTKRATTADTQHPRKKPNARIAIRQHSEHKPEQTPQRKSSRKRRFVYDSLDFDDENLSETENAQSLEAVAEAATEGEEPSEAVQDAQVAEQSAAPTAIPATAPAGPVPEVYSGPYPVRADASDVEQPVASPVLSPMQPEVTGLGEEQTLQEDLEREAELALARGQKATEVPSGAPTTNHAANAGMPSIDAFLFSRVNALSPSGTTEEKSAQVLEYLEHATRAHETPMGLVHDPGLQFLAAGHHASPPHPEMGEYERHETANVPRQSTESVKEMTAAASDCTDAAHISTMTPGMGSARVIPERSTPPCAGAGPSLATSPRATAPKKQEPTTKEPEESSAAAAPQMPPAVQSELRVIVRYGPKLHKKWDAAPSLKDLTMAKIKKEIQLELSDDFRGFKFTFVGAGERHIFEIEDGDEPEFVYLKLDVGEVMEDLEEKNQGKGERLLFQLRIEELRDAGVKEDRADF